jgi:hypothetical protein
MDNANTTPIVGQKADEPANDAGKRERSKIGFVYNDLESAIDLARTLQSRAGTSCEIRQLASWMNQSADGGTFRSVLGAARAFGLIETGQGSVSLTTLGRESLDESKRQGALAEAFLRVQLHNAMYDQYQGYALPPPAAIERQIEALGVPTKQKERARQTFTKSAQFAGFVDPQTGRFIKPATAVAPPAPPGLNDPKGHGGGVGGNGGGAGGSDTLALDPLLMALLKKIPPSGQAWPKEQRVRWFRTFAMNVSQIYDEAEDAIDLKIDADAIKKE